MYVYASICITMEPHAAICLKKACFNTPHVTKNMKNRELAQMAILTMSYMQDLCVIPIAHSTSSQSPYMVKTNMQKKKSAADSDPLKYAAAGLSPASDGVPDQSQRRANVMPTLCEEQKQG